MKKYLLFALISLIAFVGVLAQTTITGTSQTYYIAPTPKYYPKYGYLPNQDNTFRNLDLGYQILTPPANSIITVTSYIGKFYESNIIVTNTGANLTVFGINVGKDAYFANSMNLWFKGGASSTNITFINSGTTLGFVAYSNMSVAGINKNTRATFRFDGSNFIEMARFIQP